MTDVLHVHADLMRATGFEPATQQAQTGMPLHHVVMRDGRFAQRVHHALGAVVRVAPDRRVDAAGAIDFTVHQRDVFALHSARLQLAHQIGLRDQRFGNHQQTRSVLVEPMHDTRARQFRDLRHMMQQRIEQGAARIAIAGMHNQTHRFVDHQHLIVFKHDTERDGFRRIGRRIGFQRRLHAHALAAVDHHPGGSKLAIHRDLPRAYPGLNAIARKLRQQSGQSLVEPQPGLAVGDPQLAGVRVRISLIIGQTSTVVSHVHILYLHVAFYHPRARHCDAEHRVVHVRLRSVPQNQG